MWTGLLQLQTICRKERESFAKAASHLGIVADVLGKAEEHSRAVLCVFLQVHLRVLTRLQILNDNEPARSMSRSTSISGYAYSPLL